MSFADEDYERGAQLTYDVVASWKGAPPRFAFPPKEYALLADLRGIGQRLARNDGARELVALLIKRCVERTGRAPTAMMLLVVLETLGHQIERVSLSELGLNVGTT